MTLKEQIEAKAQQAQKEHAEMELGVLRLLKSAIKNVEIDKGHELNDEEVLVVLEKQAKQRKDSIEQFEAAGREDLAKVERDELALITTMLPEKMNEEEVRVIVRDVIANNPEADFGRTMGMAMGQLRGKADGALVQNIVRQEKGA